MKLPIVTVGKVDACERLILQIRLYNNYNAEENKKTA